MSTLKFRDDPIENRSCTLFHEDALKVFHEHIDDETIDCIITDPPYSSLEKHRKIGTTTRLKDNWFEVVSNNYLLEVLKELWRILKPNTHCYIMCDFETMQVLVESAPKIGFKVWTPIIWDKISLGMGYHYRSRYEFILFFEKGKRKLHDLSIPNVLAHKRIRGGYPTEKPVGLLEILVHQSTEMDEIIMDPFMGSCSTGVAALQNGRRFIGCDTSERSLKIAMERTGKL